MVVLLLFNDAEQLSYREIAEATEIPALELKRSLQSLACAKGEAAAHMVHNDTCLMLASSAPAFQLC
jgi:hypothetical protein